MPVPCRLAAIADDFTGGSDLAGMLYENGARTVQIFGLQPEEFVRNLAGRYDAAVLSLKSRSIPAAEACRMSLEALDRLAPLAPAQIQFKYCSTFDSTPAGNIGPVTAALMDKLETDFTIAAPALPVNGRTQYLGYLFVGSQLLSETHMRHHPVTPMTDSNLVRLLQRQTGRKVGLIALPSVDAGPETIKKEIQRLRGERVAIALVDATVDRHLESVAEAVAQMRLVTGGSGIAGKLPAVWRSGGWSGKPGEPVRERPKRCVILSGSCSAATLRQLDELASTACAMFRMDVPNLLPAGEKELERLFASAMPAVERDDCAAIFSSAPPEARQGTAGAAELIELAFGQLARRFVAEAGVTGFVVAGGETSGAVVSALGIPAVEITGILDPGVPCLRALGTPALALALKSGNFGSNDFFTKAVKQL